MNSISWTTPALAVKWAFAALFILGGVGHFVATDVYTRIMPPYLPYHRALVLLSGVFEVALGILLLVPKTSRFAAWGLIALLVAVFPANVFMFQHPERFHLPPSLLLLRLPLQGALILWAYAYTRRPAARRPPRLPGRGDAVHDHRPGTGEVGAEPPRLPPQDHTADDRSEFNP